MLSVEFVFHAPRRSLATTSDPNDLAPRSHTLLTHRNTLNTSLSDLLQQHLLTKNGDPDSSIPDWVRELVPAPSSTPSTSKEDLPDIVYLLLKHPPTPPKNHYHPLDVSLSLEQLLRKKRFIEWPTVHISLADEFDEGHIIGQETPDTREDDLPSYPYKKRKLNPQAGKKVLSGLVGGYASDSDAEDDDEDAEGSDEDAEGEADGMMGLLEYESGGESGQPEASWGHVPRGESLSSLIFSLP